MEGNCDYLNRKFENNKSSNIYLFPITNKKFWKYKKYFTFCCRSCTVRSKSTPQNKIKANKFNNTETGVRNSTTSSTAYTEYKGSTRMDRTPFSD